MHRALTSWLLAGFFCLVAAQASEEPGEKVWRVGVEAGDGVITALDATGKPTGFGPLLLDAFGKEMGVRIQWVVKPWHELLEDIRLGHIEVISMLAFTPQRDEFIDFSVSVLDLKPGAFGRKGAARPRDLHDLKGYRLAVQRMSFFESYLRGMGTQGEFVYANSVSDRLAAVANNKADIAFVAYGLRNDDDIVISGHRNLGLEPLDLEFPRMNYRLYYGVREGDKQRLAILNEGLMRLRENGTYAELYEKWIGPLEHRNLRFRDLWRGILPFVLLAVLGLAFAVWQRRLMLRLRVRTVALRDSEEKLKLVLESGDHGYWQADYSLDKVDRSPRANAMLGYGDKDVPPAVDAELAFAHPEDKLKGALARTEALSSGQRNFSYELRIQSPEGGWRWVQVKGKVLELNPDGTALRAAGTMTDITEAKHAQTEREEVQRKVLEAQRLEGVGLLAGGVAHDFNNLLTVIIGNIGLARLDNPARGSLPRHLDQIEAAARRAANMCRQLLASAGRATIQLEAVELNSAITDTLQLINPSIPPKVEVQLELLPHLPPVEADATQIRQIIMNLVLNAAEAIGENKGRITIRTSTLAPVAESGEEIVQAPRDSHMRQACLTVADTGSGMKPEVKRRIFEPFFTTKFTGRGLGLAASIGLLRSFGGGLFLASAEGRGTTFRVFFPFSTRAESTQTQEAETVSPGQVHARGCVMVVDDESAVLAVATSALAGVGYQVVSARDAVEAMAQFRVRPNDFDAVLIDLTMPVTDGATLLSELRAIRPNLPAMMMSGFSAEHVLTRLPRTNPPPILRKPFDCDELIRAMQELLRTPA